MDSKICNGCGESKLLTEFHNRTVSSDGKDSQCKVCRSRYFRDDAEVTTLSVVKQNPINYKRVGIPAEEILTLIGYELYNPDNTVYSQFKGRCIDKGIDVSDWD